MTTSSTTSVREAPSEARRETSSRTNVVEFPARYDHVGRASLHEVAFALATAGDLASTMGALVEWLQERSGVSRVEWWATSDDGAATLVAAAGSPRPRRSNLRLGRAGVLVLHGGRVNEQLESALLSLAPILRRRAAEERLTQTSMRLARRNEALEDFAALVAHELKTPLQAALLSEDPAGPLEDALWLVESLLQASQDEANDGTFASPAACVDQAVEDLGADIAVTTNAATTLPLPAESLRVILRNLLANAVAAGARSVHVTAVRSSSAWRLIVDDDGVGLADGVGYASGSGLGLTLCGRIARRFSGRLELSPRAAGGTRATLELAAAPE